MKKKNTFATLLAVALMFSCGNKNNAPVAEFAEPETLQNGDLIFALVPSDYSLDSTAANYGDTSKVEYIHVSVANVENDSVFIIDATLARGVARYPLADYLKDFMFPDGSELVFKVKRLRDTTGVYGFVQTAKTFLGKPFDVHFNLGNDSVYCSEMVYNSYVKDGRHLFSLNPIDFKNADGVMSPYFESLFKRIEKPVPQGKKGILPRDMFGEHLLVPVNVDITK